MEGRPPLKTFHSCSHRFFRVHLLSLELSTRRGQRAALSNAGTQTKGKGAS